MNRAVSQVFCNLTSDNCLDKRKGDEIARMLNEGGAEKHKILIYAN